MAQRSQGVFRLRRLIPVHYWRWSGSAAFLIMTCSLIAYALRISVEEKGFGKISDLSMSGTSEHTKRLIPGKF
jgi:hypothetical protein